MAAAGPARNGARTKGSYSPGPGPGSRDGDGIRRPMLYPGARACLGDGEEKGMVEEDGECAPV